MTDQYASFRHDFFALIDASSHSVITAHLSPDDDSIGSIISLHQYLRARYPDKTIRAVYGGDMPKRFATLAGIEMIEFVNDIAEHVAGVDTFIMLDCNSYNRVSRQPGVLAAIPTRICIDHHGTAPDAFTLQLIVPEYSSNSQLMYDAVIREEGLNKTIAQVLMLGILGDTGNFIHIGPSQASVFAVAQQLMPYFDTPLDVFKSRFTSIPQRLLPLLQALVANTKYGEHVGWPNYQYTYIDIAMLHSADYTDEDMSAASHIYMGQYLPRIEGYNWGFVLTPRKDGSVRMSGRSLQGSVNIRDMFERMNIGGGHDRASGGAFKPIDGIPLEPTACLATVIAWISSNTPAIN